MREQGVYLWRVKVFKREYYRTRTTIWVGDEDIQTYEVPELARVFKSKISAMDYATKMRSKRSRDGFYHIAKLEKWFGD